MPIYRFKIDSPLTTQVVLQRIQGLARAAPGFWQSIRGVFGRDRTQSTPFIGAVEGESFRLHRDIAYRNSFLPRISGRVVATPAGTRIIVNMFLHPIVGAFMLFWLSGVGIAALTSFNTLHGTTSPVLVPLGMFVFGVALTLGGFYPEAVKARRLLEQGIGVAGG